MSKRDRKNGVPETVTSIPLVDPHALPDNPSIGDLVRDASTQVSTLVRAEVELAKAEITRDVKRGLTGSVFFIVAGVVLLYSTFFMFFFLAELLDTWLWRWAAFLIVFLLMLAVTALFAFLGYRKVRKIRGPQQTIESVKETTAALTPGLQKFAGGGQASTPAVTAAPKPRPAVAPAPSWKTAPPPAPAAPVAAAPVAERAPVVDVRDAPAAVDVDDEPTVQYEATVIAEETVFSVPESYSDTAEAYSDESAYSDETAYSDEAVHYEPASYTDDTVVLTDAVYSDEPTGPIPPIQDRSDDPTAAIYSDTGLLVTPEHDHRPGDPSGS